MPVYVDGYAYTGIMNIQVTEKGWPETVPAMDAGQMKAMEVLEKSSRLPEAPHLSM